MAGARYFDPNEMARLEQQAREAERRSYLGQSVTQQSADAITQYARYYPNLNGRVVVPLAATGVQPGSAPAEAAAQADVKAKASGGGFGGFVKGGFAKAIGGAGKALSAITPDFVGDAINSGPVKTFARGATAGLSALPQAIQGEFRNNLADDGRISFGEVLGVLNPANLDFEQTDLGVALDAVQRNGWRNTLDSDRTDVDQMYGKGFFVSGEIEKERIRRTRAAAADFLIDGKAPSIGRYYGAKVFEPGTKSYNFLSGLVDGAVVLGADPTTWLGGGVGVVGKLGSDGVRQAKQAGRLFEGEASSAFKSSGKTIEVEAKSGLRVGGGPENEAARLKQIEDAGGTPGAIRKTVLPDRVAEWLLGKDGQKVVKYLTDETDLYQLRVMFKGKIENDDLVKLADARTTDDVYNVLGPQLGVNIREKLALPGAARATIRRGLNDVRMAGMLPGTHVNLHDADEAVEQLDRLLLNAKVDPEYKARTVEKMMRETNANGRFKVLTDAMGDSRGVLGSLGLDPEDANALTRLYSDYVSDAAKFAVDEIGNNAIVPGVVLDGAGMPLPTPHLLAQYVGRAVPLPDAREMRMVTSKFGRVIKGVPGLEPTVAGLDFVTQQMFKPLVLLRGAWTVRVVGEEQVRLAASGRSSIFRDPLSHIALATGKRLDKGVMGDDLAQTDEAIDALSRGSNSFLELTEGTKKAANGRKKIATNRFRLYERGLPGYNRAWADEIGDFARDPIASRIAGGGLRAGDRTPNPAEGLDGIKDWFFEGVGRKFRKEMMAAPDRAFLATRQGADEYIDSVLQQLTVKTGGDPLLNEVVATGKFAGESIFDAGVTGIKQQRRAADAFVKELAERAGRQEGPLKVKGDDFVSVKMSPGNKAGEAKDRVVETLFNTLMSRPTNFLSRSPAFKQFYYQRIEELVGFMDNATQAEARAAAEAAGLDKNSLARMDKAIKSGRSGELNLEEVDILAKGFGLDSTRKLLYSMHERSQFFDINRMLFPFGEAWKEVLTTWAKIGTENPVIPYRATQLIEGGRDADLDGDGQGFFYPDPMTGEEMLAIPFSEEFTGLVTGIGGGPGMPTKFEGPVKSLNIFGQSVIPGFGPVVQIATSKLLPDEPEFDFIRKNVIPFGETDTSGGVLESFLPAWYKKFITSGYVVPALRSDKQERAYMNTVTDVIRYLKSTGEYGNTPEENDRIMQDAKSKASRLFVLRGMTQFISPTPPSPEFVAKDKDGNAILTFRLAEEYRAMQEQDYKTATARFIEKFGENAFLTTISKTEGGTTPTKAASDFARRNPEIERQFGATFAFFTEAGGEFDMTAYQRQLDSGQRETRTPEDALALANQRIGTMLYQQAQLRAGLIDDRGNRTGHTADAQTKQYLRTVKDKLVEQYPGYTSGFDNSKTPKLVAELLRAGRNEKLAATDAGQGLALYVQARQRATREANAMGLESFEKSPKAAGIRNWLRNVGDAIGERHRDFTPMFDNILERELGDDERETTNG